MAGDYYEILGVSRNASKDEIKSAYRKMARKYHPDVNQDPGAEERFKEISRAYEVLSDPETKARYDRFGEAGVGGAGSGGVGFDPTDMGGFADIFETFFLVVVLAGVQVPKPVGADRQEEMTYGLTYA